MQKKIYKNKIVNVFALLIIFFFTERSIKKAFIFSFSYRMQTITTLMLIICSAVVMLFFIYYLIKNKYLKINVIVLYCAIYFCALISTIINGGSFKRIFDSFIFSVPPLLLTSICLSRESWKKIYIRVGLCIFIMLAAVNIAFIKDHNLFFVISQWDEQYFLGYHTEIGFPLLLGAFFAMMSWQVLEDRVCPIVYFALFFANIYMSNAGTTKIVALIVLMYLIVPPIKKAFKNWNFLVFGLAIIAIFVLLTVFVERITNIEVVKDLLRAKLNRDSTLSGRTIIWRGIYPLIFEKPLFGHGIKESASFYLDNEFNHTYVHAHNLFIQTLYEIGLMGLIAAGSMIAFATKSFDDKSKISADIKFMLFAMLFAMQCEIDAYYPWYIIAFICNFGVSCIQQDKIGD